MIRWQPQERPHAWCNIPTLLLAAATVALVSCAADAPEVASDNAAPATPEIASEVVLEGLEVVISDADVDLAIPAGIDVDAEGNVWIVDRRLAQVLVVDPEGAVLRTFGRAGGGPGEFRFPRGMGIRGEHAYVLDNVHGVQSFGLEGNYVDEYQAPRLTADFDFTGDGGLVNNNNRVWVGGGMVSVLAPGAEEPVLFGELLFPDTSGFNFRAFDQQVREGTIPDLLRNGGIPAAAADGTVWLAIHTEQIVRRYAADGTLLSETTFELPELLAIIDQYLADFASLPQGDAFFFPSVIGAAHAVGDSLLLLWETVEGEPGLITVHGPDGSLIQRLVIPGLEIGGGGTSVMDLTVDEDRRRLYISISEIATIFGVDLPDSVAF